MIQALDILHQVIRLRLKHLPGEHDQESHNPHKGAGVAKEPYQMTKAEFEAQSPVRSFDDVKMGEPVTLIAYHGTDSPEAIRREGFRVPENEKNPLVGSVQGKFVNREERDRQGFLGKGVYFTDSKNIAGNYGEPLEIQVKLEKPYVITHGDVESLRKLDLNELKAEGYDGIVMKQGKYGLTGESYRQGIVFDPSKASAMTEKVKPTKVAKGAVVRNLKTGEVGDVSQVTALGEGPKEFWQGQGANFDSFVEVKWRAKKGQKARRDYNVRDTDIAVVGGHRDLVEQALREGKRVPANVLADYPDLVSK